MIPTIEEILAMLAKGECTQDQALQWIGSHIDSAVSRVALLDTFASMATIGVRGEEDTVISYSDAVALMGGERTGSTDLDDIKWWADAEARLRYVKAESMMKARIL